MVNDKVEQAAILDGRMTGVTRMNFMSQGGDSAAAVCNMNPFAPFGRLCPDTFHWVPNALSNIQYALFRRQRLGLTIAPCPPDVRPHHHVCRKCGKQLDDYATHADSCKFTNGGRITRHSAVRTVLYKALNVIPDGFAVSEPPVRSLGFVHDKSARTGAAKYNVVTSADVSLNVASNCAGPAPSSTIVVDARIVFPSSKSTEKERGTVQRANGVITAGAGSKPDHGIDEAVADKFTHYSPLQHPGRQMCAIRHVDGWGVSHPCPVLSPAYCTHAGEQHSQGVGGAAAGGGWEGTHPIRSSSPDAHR
jgi:hypothetical protein